VSNAARKARKRTRQGALEAVQHIDDAWVRNEYVEAVVAPTAFQHPTREGIPYGHSKQPNLSAALPGSREIEQTALMLKMAREGALWH
jgi:hypothetical protein